MKITNKYYATFLLLAVTFAGCKQEGMPSLRETFSKKDKDPFGAYVFFDQAGLIFNRNVLHTKKENFENVWQNISDTASLYISISKNLFLSQADEKAMLGFADNGNSIFISSESIDEGLLDTLGCKAFSANAADETWDKLQNTAVVMDTAVYDEMGKYGYYYLPLKNYFTSFDTGITTVLGRNDFGKPDFIEIFYGKGRFYLHCEPRALSNYFLLQKRNYEYLQNIFAFTSAVPEHVYWDDYYNKRTHPPTEKGSKSGIMLLLQYPPMAWAFWLLISLLALYILFGSKRRQRIVNAIAPNINTTVTFTETVGHLYLQKKDNRNIADKMIMYFQEYIRKQYYLNTGQPNDDFITALSRKSNVPKEIAENLFATIQQIQQSQQISDVQLLSLNHQIENFYKNKI